LLAHGLLHYSRLDETIEAAMTAWQDARRIRPELNIDKIRWMAGPEQLQQLQNMGIL